MTKEKKTADDAIIEPTLVGLDGTAYYSLIDAQQFLAVHKLKYTTNGLRKLLIKRHVIKYRVEGMNSVFIKKVDLEKILTPLPLEEEEELEELVGEE